MARLDGVLLYSFWGGRRYAGNGALYHWTVLYGSTIYAACDLIMNESWGYERFQYSIYAVTECDPQASGVRTVQRVGACKARSRCRTHKSNFFLYKIAIATGNARVSAEVHTYIWSKFCHKINGHRSFPQLKKGDTNGGGNFIILKQVTLQCLLHYVSKHPIVRLTILRNRSCFTPFVSI